MSNVDIELNEELTAQEIAERLKKHLPPALELYALKIVDDKTPPVMSIIQRAEYRVSVKLAQSVPLAEIEKTIDELLASPRLEVERRKKNSREKKTGGYSSRHLSNYCRISRRAAHNQAVFAK